MATEKNVGAFLCVEKSINVITTPWKADKCMILMLEDYRYGLNAIPIHLSSCSSIDFWKDSRSISKTRLSLLFVPSIFDNTVTTCTFAFWFSHYTILDLDVALD